MKREILRSLIKVTCTISLADLSTDHSCLNKLEILTRISPRAHFGVLVKDSSLSPLGSLGCHDSRELSESPRYPLIELTFNLLNGAILIIKSGQLSVIISNRYQESR